MEESMFLPNLILYEEDIKNYELGRELLDKYSKYNIEMRTIENHNNIEEMRNNPNKNFPKLKQNLILPSLSSKETHYFIDDFPKNIKKAKILK